MTGVNMVEEPCRGTSAALPDLLGGDVQVMFDALRAERRHRLKNFSATPNF